MANRFSFEDFVPKASAPSPLRAAIEAAYRRPEPECLAPLLAAARQPASLQASIAATARNLVERLRANQKKSGIAALVHEFSLSSREGVALMCLAEALLRIPDMATRDALIRDKLVGRDWSSHLGGERSLFVNAAAWGMVLSGQLLSDSTNDDLGSALHRLTARMGEPVIRRAVTSAMQMMGDQFVTGRNIKQALTRARAQEKLGFTYSYDMLGEAAMTALDAQRYYEKYETAIHAIGKASAGRGIVAGPGISIKLSALHPRYTYTQADRVMTELLPRVEALAALAKSYNIGLNIDAEEQDRLELSLDMLEQLCFSPKLSGWDGLGFVVQAYGKRCPFVLDFIIDLARRSGRRLMVRLVKGAYWDAEIKRCQVDGLSNFPVYTRKTHTDVAYLACAQKLLDARRDIFPQFATHNAQTIAAIYNMAGSTFTLGDYEFQCLHGMGEPLYEHVVGADNLNRPCRIYAPVGNHDSLLAYLTRRLLENGANSSFVNRIADPEIPVDALTADPVEETLAMPEPGAPHPLIALPSNLFPHRPNSAGIDLSHAPERARIQSALIASTQKAWTANGIARTNPPRDVLNPADLRDTVGTVTFATPAEAASAADRASNASWVAMPVPARALVLEQAADLMQAHMDELLGLIVREAGKSLPNAIGEIREAIDFLRYYAEQGRKTLTAEHAPLGTVASISPWNFPLAIFTGQISAALMAGNAVLAKPAEETPLIAAEAVRILHEAGVPESALQLVPGEGDIGAALVNAPQVSGILFTGSTEVARKIQAQLAGRLLANGKPIPLIAETGGQNAMIVDSSALTEQVVTNVLASAFDSAGQRCSALRILCLQEDIADKTLEMLKGALAEMVLRPTDQLRSDIGPVISAEAKAAIERHIVRLRTTGARLTQHAPDTGASHGTFSALTIAEISDPGELGPEVFGPVLHIVRYRRDDLDLLIDALNAMGYGLTFSIQTRSDETIAEVTQRIEAGNIYVNRNMIGAVVGVQPFGGHHNSGTGPKAGGPLYLGRLVEGPDIGPTGTVSADGPLPDFISWLKGFDPAAALNAGQYLERSCTGHTATLDGPVGESNVYGVHARGTILAMAATRAGLIEQISAALATGNTIALEATDEVHGVLAGLPKSVAASIRRGAAGPIDGALIEGNPAQVSSALRRLAEMEGPLVLAQSANPEECKAGGAYRLDWLVKEVSVSTDTTAAGGNATLMAMV